MTDIPLRILVKLLYSQWRRRRTGPGSAIRPTNLTPRTSLTSSPRPDPATGDTVHTRPPNKPLRRTPRREPRSWSITIVRVPRGDHQRPHGLDALGCGMPGDLKPPARHGEPWRPAALPLEKLVQQQRRAQCYATVKLTLNIVFVEIWFTGLLATIGGLAGQTQERALTLITHPWELLSDPHTSSVLWTGSVIVIVILTLASLIGSVLGILLAGPRRDPAAIRRHYLGHD